ncbi:MBL fold metallo-hydrolase [Metallosphaera tengchongensis]|uniref:MBL fold metallo-hydrolase n=1 Tax=Metallosphaera tengchongensis TaxID=1532350 RepID=A0A6N0NTA9_9CREN|nr:MBL fold metallo-hydrolase [Metallosphaera tengchongensis]QKQ99995.1 MBL fold metallo-hydrolase [Metallosphaera tengchongensis]
MEVRIDDNGAVLIGRNFTVDGHWKRNFRIVTHFHADHIGQLKSSIKECMGIISTLPTLEVLEALGYNVPENKRIPLTYGMTTDIDSEKLTLHRSDHVFGSAQVEVEGEEETVAYTGDFKNPGEGTPILNPDVLIIESTYGKPEFRREFKREVNQLLADYVNDALSRGPVRMYGYHGKIQEAMKVLREMGVIAPFVVDEKIHRITEIAVKHGVNISDFYALPKAMEEGIMKDGWYVEFKHFNNFKSRDNKFANFLLSGWEFNLAVKRIDKSSFSVSFSDHADFDDLVYYIDNSKAKVIITDGGRGGYSRELAKYVSSVLKKKAFSLPF